MDIYFCDLCGVRVTDADLRAGHGMRDAHDVICSGCLELGHHKEWLNRRGKAKPVVAAAAAGKPVARESGDRVATLEEGIPPSRVQPKVLTADPTPSGAIPVLPEDHTSTAKVPTPGPSEMPLAGAASLFSALGSSASQANGSSKTDSRPGDDDEDDLLDQADHPPATTTPEPAESPFADDVTDNAEKAETALVAAKGGLGKAATEEAPALDDEEAKPKAKPSSKADARKSTSSRHSKPAKGKSARSARGKAGPDASRMILMGSFISLAIIGLIFGVVLAKKKGLFRSGGTPTAIGIDGDEIKDMVQSTMNKAVAAIRAEDVAQLEAAKAAIESTQSAVDSFEATAKASGNSDDQINHFLERIAKWNDCYAMKRNINDLLLRLKH